MAERKVINLPMAVNVVATFPDNPARPYDSIRPIVTVQLEGQDGSVILLPLADSVPEKLVRILLQYEKVRDSLLPPGSAGPKIIQ
ncbi:hypothetical protein SAMN05216330_104456 [Bradyrhizobium sp. Ghvi]|nr:hypothetical protein SAMN05216330_104456 [Bradyrhizobium sp. Ghvi]